MIGLIGIALIFWGVRSLVRYRIKSKSLMRSKVWAEKTLKNIENNFIEVNK